MSGEITDHPNNVSSVGGQSQQPAANNAQHANTLAHGYRVPPDTETATKADSAASKMLKSVSSEPAAPEGAKMPEASKHHGRTDDKTQNTVHSLIHPNSSGSTSGTEGMSEDEAALAAMQEDNVEEKKQMAAGGSNTPPKKNEPIIDLTQPKTDSAEVGPSVLSKKHEITNRTIDQGAKTQVAGTYEFIQGGTHTHKSVIDCVEGGDYRKVMGEQFKLIHNDPKTGKPIMSNLNDSHANGLPAGAGLFHAPTGEYHRVGGHPL